FTPGLPLAPAETTRRSTHGASRVRIGGPRHLIQHEAAHPESARGARGPHLMIEIKQLTKDFGPLRAVDGISFRVARGEVLGFLGPNGAGKSTTMKMITGFLTP